MSRIGAIGTFIGAVIAAEIVFHFAWRAFSTHHSDSPAVQGFASIIN